MLSFFKKTITVSDLFKKLLIFEKLLAAEKFLIFKELLTFKKLLTIKEFLIFRKLLILFKSFDEAIIAFDVFDNKKIDVIIDLSITKILR